MSQVTARTDARDRLVAAAVESFASKGFHGTTTRDIASAAGMSPAALYVHHRSKEDLLHLISRTGHELTLRLVRGGVASADGPGGPAGRRGARVHRPPRPQPHQRPDRQLRAGRTQPGPPREIAGLRAAIEQELRDVVEDGVRLGAFTTSNPRMTALALLSLGIDVARWFRDEGEWTPEDVAAHYCELALNMVGAISR